MSHDLPSPTSMTLRGEPEASLFDARPVMLILVLVTMFLLATGARLYRLDAPGVLLDRDFTSAIFARDFYFQGADDVEPWRKEVAHATRVNQPTLEPPVTEWLAAQAYKVIGKEDIRYARILTIAMMLTGGWFLFRTTARHRTGWRSTRTAIWSLPVRISPIRSSPVA